MRADWWSEKPGYLMTFFGVLGLLILVASFLPRCSIVPHHPSAVELPASDVDAGLHSAVEYSRYSAPWFDRPQVYVLPDMNFDSLFCGKQGPECGIVGATEYSGPHYIYIRQSELSNPVEFRSTLVHEIVHWLQARSGWGFHKKDCTNAAAQEAEAYAVEYVYKFRVEHQAVPFWAPHFDCDEYPAEEEPWK